MNTITLKHKAQAFLIVFLGILLILIGSLSCSSADDYQVDCEADQAYEDPDYESQCESVDTGKEPFEWVDSEGMTITLDQESD